MSSAQTAQSSKALIEFRPWAFPEPQTIPRRQWLLGHALCRGVLSVLAAPGGVGKTTLAIAESVAMASDRPLYGFNTHGQPLRVMYASLEDPQDELDRRAAAICKRYGLSASNFADRLHVQSFMDTPIKVATPDRQHRARLSVEVTDQLEKEIVRNGIDVITFDPFVSLHQVDENDNIAIDVVVKRLSLLASTHNISVQLVHHMRKGTGGRDSHDAESVRGGTSIVAAARSVRVINPMSDGEAAGAGIASHQRKRYIRVSGEKQNLSAHREAQWYCMESVDLGNGQSSLIMDSDVIGVPVPYDFVVAEIQIEPSALDRILNKIDLGNYVAARQARAWVGNLLASELSLSPKDKGTRRRLADLIDDLLARGVLIIVDQICPLQRRKRAFVRVGERPDGAPSDN